MLIIIGLAVWLLLALIGLACCMKASRVSQQVEKWRGRD